MSYVAGLIWGLGPGPGVKGIDVSHERLAVTIRDWPQDKKDAGDTPEFLTELAKVVYLEELRDTLRPLSSMRFVKESK